MHTNFRSQCPIATALDILGDKWTLLIVRDMLTQSKKTFKDFSIAPEGIAPGVLSSRLKWMEENGLLTKRKLPDNHKENVYLLTEKGIGLAPLIVDIILWSDQHLRLQNPQMFLISDLGLDRDVSEVTLSIQNRYRHFVRKILG